MTPTPGTKITESRLKAFSKLFVVSILSASSLTMGLGLNAEAFVRAHASNLSVKLGSAVRATRPQTHRPNYGNLPHRPAYAARYALAHGAKGKALQAKLAKLARQQKGKGKAAWQAEVQVAAKPIQPQNFIADLQSETIAPGVVHKFVRGPLSINVIDVDMERAPVKVQPYMAGETFDQLKDVADHARESKALAAINANYFKKDGTPLGTLIVDGEWVAGPIFDRVSMGIDRDGKVKIDRVSLNGLLNSSNSDVDNVWVNNINQPRRHGTKLIAYTRRWGTFVRTPLEGCLVAVNARGEVQDKTVATSIGIPYGGFVLSDTKEGAIASLERGDKVQLSWHTRPGDWQNVVEAVSGGPMLVKDGSLFVDLKDENFRKAWTGSQIRARTAIGVTANNHLLLTTIEGPHTLWDVAKFLHNMGAVDAMNLDGGGSTTMVVHGNTVTRNANASQRRVASTIVVIDQRKNVGIDEQKPTISVAPMSTTTTTTTTTTATGTQEQVADSSDVAKHLGGEPAVAGAGKEITASLPTDAPKAVTTRVVEPDAPGETNIGGDSTQAPEMVP